jgi:hypothetical protein
MNFTQLVAYANQLLNTTNTVYSLTDKANDANTTLKKIWSIIFDSYPGWEWDDRNNANLPIAYTGMITGQANYSLPPDASTIRDVEILPQNSTTYQKLTPITQEIINQYGMSDQSMFTSTGTPIYYRPIGSVIKLYPAPNYTQVESIRLTYDRGISPFVSTDTTKQPGIEPQFHEMVAIGMALEFSNRNVTSAINPFMNTWAIWEKDMRALYTRRYQERFPARLTVRDATRDYK